MSNSLPQQRRKVAAAVLLLASVAAAPGGAQTQPAASASAPMPATGEAGAPRPATPTAPQPAAVASGPKATPSAETAAAKPAKDVVVDAVPAPPRAATTVSTSGAGRSQIALSASLAELALDLMRQQSASSGDAQVNSVVSPFSLATTLGMLHAGTTGPGAQELAALMGPRTAGERAYSRQLPDLIKRLSAADAGKSRFKTASRLWVDRGVVAELPAAYLSAVQKRYRADGAVLKFSEAEAARGQINAWVSDKTAQRIPELMPSGSVLPTTRLVLTNAIHFKSPWAEPFDPARTTNKPFNLTGQASKPVPTMVGQHEVRTGVVDNVTVIELPFAGDAYALTIGMPPAGHTLNAFETDLDGSELAAWTTQLKPTTCRVELPKFDIAPKARPLKPALEALGVRTVFGPEADLTPMLGKSGRGVSVDNVFQSAMVTIDEQGGEAAAATGAAMVAKSFSPAPPVVCAVDRPFIFAITHRASGAPVFVGKVADPTRP